MITEFYENPVKKPVVTYFPQPTKTLFDRAQRLGLTVAEYERRNKIIVDKSAELVVKWGDYVVPVNPVDEEMYGVMKVMGVVRHIEQYGSVEWKENPYILTVKSVEEDKPDASINCTGNWVKPYIGKVTC